MYRNSNGFRLLFGSFNVPYFTEKCKRLGKEKPHRVGVAPRGDPQNVPAQIFSAPLSQSFKIYWVTNHLRLGHGSPHGATPTRNDVDMVGATTYNRSLIWGDPQNVPAQIFSASLSRSLHIFWFTNHIRLGHGSPHGATPTRERTHFSLRFV